MKTLKNAAIITGIIVAAFTIRTHAAESNKAEEKAAGAAEIYSQLETQLIENYLSEQKTEESTEGDLIKIFDAEDNLIYEGSAESAEAKKLINKADFLMDLDNASYYRIPE